MNKEHKTMYRKSILLLIIALLPLLAYGQSGGFWASGSSWLRQAMMWNCLAPFCRIQASAGRLDVVTEMGICTLFLDSLSLSVDGAVNAIPIRDRVWPSNVFMGLMMPIGGTRQIRRHGRTRERLYGWMKRIPYGVHRA